MVRGLIKPLLDNLKKKIEESETKWDDHLALPLIEAIENIMGIEE